MTPSEQLDMIEKALDQPNTEEKTLHEILKIVLFGMKVRHLRVKTTEAGPMKTVIAAELNGIAFKTSHFVYDTGKGIFDVRDDYEPRP